MTHPARTTILLGLLASSLACAAQSKAGAPMDAGYYAEAAPAYDDVAGAEARDDSGMQAELPAMTVGAAQAGAVMPASVMGSPAPARAVVASGDGSGGERAISDDDVPTTGDGVDQMLVFNGALSLAVAPDTIPSSIDTAADLAVAAGGYIAQQTDTTLTLRVPSGRFRKLMRGLEGLGQVRGRSVQTLDVSEEFHDLKVRLENLLATRTRIQKLLGQAKDLTEILVVEKELERLSVEIDGIEGRLRFLSSQATFSTVTLGFQELPREVVIVEPDEPPALVVPPAAPARLLDSSVEWIGEVDVQRLMSL